MNVCNKRTASINRLRLTVGTKKCLLALMVKAARSGKFRRLSLARDTTVYEADVLYYGRMYLLQFCSRNPADFSFIY